MVSFDQINKDLIQAMKDGDKAKLGTLRLIFAALKNLKINEQKKELSETDCLKILSHEAKKRKEAILAYNNGGRPELAAAEQQELEIIQKYLPIQLTEEEIKAIITKVVKENPNLKSGPLMGKVMAEVKGRAEGVMVQKILKSILES